MPINTIFQDEINASEARKSAVAKRVKSAREPSTRGTRTFGGRDQGTRRSSPVLLTPRDFIVSAVTRATQGNVAPTASGFSGRTTNPPAPVPQRGSSDSRSGSSSRRAGSDAVTGGQTRDPKTTAPNQPRLNLDEISAALDAISAMFDLQEGELTAEQAAARQAFDFLKSSLFRARDEAVEQARGVAAGRGILRSGLYLEEAGRIGDQAATQVAQAQAQRDARVRAITDRATQLAAQEEAERAVRARELARQQVGFNEDIAAALELV